MLQKSLWTRDLVKSLKEEDKYLRAENQIITTIIKTMSEKEKSLAQCSHSIIAPILDLYKGNLKSNSPSKSTCREFLNNVVEVSKEPTIHSNKNVAVQLKVPIVVILDMPVGTQITKILRRFSC